MTMLIEKLAAPIGYAEAIRRVSARTPTKEEQQKALVNIALIPAGGFIVGGTAKEFSLASATKTSKIKTHGEKELRSFARKVIKGELGGNKLPIVIKAGRNSWFIPTETGLGKIVSVPRMDILAHELGHARQRFKGKKLLGGVLTVIPREFGASARAIKYLYQYGGKRGLKGLARAAKGVPALAVAFTTYAAPAVGPLALIIGGVRHIKSELDLVAKEAKKTGKT